MDGNIVAQSQCNHHFFRALTLRMEEHIEHWNNRLGYYQPPMDDRSHFSDHSILTCGPETEEELLSEADAIPNTQDEWPTMHLDPRLFQSDTVYRDDSPVLTRETSELVPEILPDPSLLRYTESDTESEIHWMLRAQANQLNSDLGEDLSGLGVDEDEPELPFMIDVEPDPDTEETLDDAFAQAIERARSNGLLRFRDESMFMLNTHDDPGTPHAPGLTLLPENSSVETTAQSQNRLHGNENHSEIIQESLTNELTGTVTRTSMDSTGQVAFINRQTMPNNLPLTEDPRHRSSLITEVITHQILTRSCDRCEPTWKQRGRYCSKCQNDVDARFEPERMTTEAHCYGCSIRARKESLYHNRHQEQCYYPDVITVRTSPYRPGPYEQSLPISPTRSSASSSNPVSITPRPSLPVPTSPRPSSPPIMSQTTPSTLQVRTGCSTYVAK